MSPTPGIVTCDYDLTGIFGTVGGNNDLVGQSYTAKFTFDTSLGTPDSNPGPHAYQQIYGGTNWGTTSPVIGATVTIGSVTVSVPATYDGHDVHSPIHDGYGFGQQYHFAQRYTTRPVYSNLYSQALCLCQRWQRPFLAHRAIYLHSDRQLSIYFTTTSTTTISAHMFKTPMSKPSVTSLTVTSGVPNPPPGP